MLHELLLSLSGHPSALFDTQHQSAHVTSTTVSLLSPPETELLSSLAHLSRLHRQIRDHVSKIVASHPSVICRAVASAISAHHLDKFQRKVLEVESNILKQDASTVGAYNIVPLAGVVGEFSEWTRLMEWLWYMIDFMMASEKSEQKANQPIASGAEIIDRLRTEAQTGYPDIESAALYLSTVAETSWLRQLATWLLYGRLPSFGASDFFISSDSDDDLSFDINHRLLPKFVTRQTASSMLFVGKSINQIRSLQSSAKLLTVSGSAKSPSGLELLPVHVKYLSDVSAPIAAARLSDAVGNIRLSLSRNLLQHLLPREKIAEVITVLYQFFLLGRGEFGMALIAEADAKLQSRHRNPTSLKPGHAIQGILLREAEINSTLSKSWSVLSALGGEDDHTDDILDVAIATIHLTTPTTSSNRPGTPGRAKESVTIFSKISNVVFHDLLLSAPTFLTMDLHSPLDLFLSKSDLDTYSSINAYLIATRRAHLHLEQLWKHSWIRREHPPPPGYQFSNSVHGKSILKRRRERMEERTREMRKVWATCAAAIFFLSETEGYFLGEVLQESFKHFSQWVNGPVGSQGSSEDAGVDESEQRNGENQQHDPEALSSGHRQFLASICYSLLLTDIPFTKAIRDFCTHVDELVAFVFRLQLIRQNLDLEEDDGVEDFMTNYKQEEKDVAIELDRARRRLDSDMKTLIARLRDIDAERVGSGPELNLSGRSEENAYEAVRVGGVDRLLMKLDWGVTDEEEDEEQ